MLRLTAGIVALSLFLLVLAACGGNGGANTPEGTVKNVEKAFNAGNIAKALYRTCPPSYREVVSLEDFERFYGDIEAMVAGLGTAKIESRDAGVYQTLSSDRVEVEFEVYIEGERSHTERQVMVRENGKWYQPCE